jgi:hypothetical protein
MLEMLDCRYFKKIPILKQTSESDGIEEKFLIHCMIGMGGKEGCSPYCPFYETL